MENLKQEIINYLNKHELMNLATSSKDGMPAAATVAYIVNEDNIYFGTYKTSEKAQNIQNNPNVALTVDEDEIDWKTIQGVQLQGIASIVTDKEELEKVNQIFGKKFPQVRFCCLTGPN